MTAHVLAIVQLPPPVTGLSAVNERMVEELSRVGKLAAVADVASPNGATGLRKHLGRLVRILSAAGLLIRSRAQGATTVYMPSDGRAGMVGNIALILVARAMRYRIWVHHHNFSYLNRWSLLMWLQLSLAPCAVVHLALCPDMLERLKVRYAGPWRRRRHVGRTLSNAFMAAPGPPAAVRSGPLVIGHLSNLMVSKGAIRFIELFAAARDLGLPIRAEMAGPIWDEDVRDAVEAAEAQYPESFRWHGPLYGPAKAQFYAGIDAFVLPTDYLNEAQPVVLLEALSAGAAVLATARGCIPYDFANAPGLIAPLASFDHAALAWLAEYANGEGRAELQRAAEATFSRMHAESEASLAETLDAL
ncbi:MAG: glycosyltransferase family 4 protein [Brevundimonas sp.]|jgi:glycosyltransferase involved in cell wall biosynthesis|nr:glycosyltransferase family 4 protein [Brevundimonas sp.]